MTLELKVDNEKRCWDCNKPLRSYIEQKRGECVQCFAILDGPYDEDNQGTSKGE